MMKTCNIPNCGRKYEMGGGHGMCPGHYMRWHQGKRDEELNAPLRPHVPSGVTLKNEDAERVWMLLYNVCSNGWPEGLDQPGDIVGTLRDLDRIRLQLEAALFKET